MVFVIQKSRSKTICFFATRLSLYCTGHDPGHDKPLCAQIQDQDGKHRQHEKCKCQIQFCHILTKVDNLCQWRHLRLLLPHISLGKTFLKFLRFVSRVPIENYPTGVERKYELFEICFLFLRPSDNGRLLILNDTYLNLLCFFDCNPHLGMSFGWLSFADWIYFNIWKSCIFITRKR